MDAADGRLVAYIDERLFGGVLLEVRINQNGHLAVCGRADGRDFVVDGMLRRTAGESFRYGGELIVPEPLDAGWRHLPF